MIEKHYNLSCYTIEHPFTACYNCENQSERIYLFDSNNQIYQFLLPDTDNYEKIKSDKKINQIIRFKDYLFYIEENHISIFKQTEVILVLKEVSFFEYFRQHNIYYILYVKKHSNQLNVGCIDVSHQQDIVWSSKIIPGINITEQNQLASYVYSNIKNIKYLYKNFIIYGEDNDILKYQLVKISNQISIKFHEAHHQIGSQFTINSKFDQYLLLSSKGKLYIYDLQSNNLVELGCAFNEDYVFWVWNQLILLIDNSFIIIADKLQGEMIFKLRMEQILEQFEEGSSIIIDKEEHNEARFSLLFDKMSRQNSKRYLFDKKRMAVYLLNIQNILNRSMRQTNQLTENKRQEHINILKTLTFRIKMMQSLEKYILESQKNCNYSNCIRFLQNQNNIAVVNDGLRLLFHSLSKDSKILKQKQMLVQLQRQIIKICAKLIQSKYEGHIETGLHLLNLSYNLFNAETNLKPKEQYQKVVESKRIARLLSQQKKVRLFQLAYQLALKVKGFKYIDDLQNNKQLK